MAFLQVPVQENACHMCKSHGGLTANVKLHFFVIFLTCDTKVKGHLGQGQRSHESRSNKGSKQRYMGSRQCQVASFSFCD